jgi:hypothetical protein
MKTINDFRAQLSFMSSKEEKVQFLTNEYRYSNLAEPDYLSLLAEIIGASRQGNGTAQVLCE